MHPPASAGPRASICCGASASATSTVSIRPITPSIVHSPSPSQSITSPRSDTRRQHSRHPLCMPTCALSFPSFPSHRCAVPGNVHVHAARRRLPVVAQSPIGARTTSMHKLPVPVRRRPDRRDRVTQFFRLQVHHPTHCLQPARHPALVPIGGVPRPPGQGRRGPRPAVPPHVSCDVRLTDCVSRLTCHITSHLSRATHLRSLQDMPSRASSCPSASDARSSRPRPSPLAVRICMHICMRMHVHACTCTCGTRPRPPSQWAILTELVSPGPYLGPMRPSPALGRA